MFGNARAWIQRHVVWTAENLLTTYIAVQYIFCLQSREHNFEQCHNVRSPNIWLWLAIFGSEFMLLVDHSTLSTMLTLFGDGQSHAIILVMPIHLGPSRTSPRWNRDIQQTTSR